MRLLPAAFALLLASACGGVEQDCHAQYQQCAVDVIIGCERPGFSEDCAINSIPACDSMYALCAGEDDCQPVVDRCFAECTSNEEACRQECDYRRSRCLRDGP